MEHPTDLLPSPQYSPLSPPDGTPTPTTSSQPSQDPTTPPPAPKTWRTVAIIICLLAIIGGCAGGGYFSWRSLNHFQTGIGVPGSASDRKSPPPLATIHFSRTSAPVTSTASTVLVAVDGSGQVSGQTETATVSAVSAGPFDAVYTSGSRVVVTLSVTNPARKGAPVVSPAGLTLTSTLNSYTCTTVSSVSVAPLTTVTQACALPVQQVQADSWSYVSAAPKLRYHGRNKPGGMNAGYIVPAGCGNPQPAIQAVQSSLIAQLASETPAGSDVFYGPVFSISATTITCTPEAGTDQPSPFSYIQQLGGAATESSFTVADVQKYEIQNLQTLASAQPGDVLVSSSLCAGGPTIQPGATATAAHVSCPSSGTAGWNWDATALHNLAIELTGVTVASAQATLTSTPGILADTVRITTVNNASTLPDNADAIAFDIT